MILLIGVYAVLSFLFLPFVVNFQSSLCVICCLYVLHDSEREPEPLYPSKARPTTKATRDALSNVLGEIQKPLRIKDNVSLVQLRNPVEEGLKVKVDRVASTLPGVIVTDCATNGRWLTVACCSRGGMSETTIC